MNDQRNAAFIEREDRQKWFNMIMSPLTDAERVDRERMDREEAAAITDKSPMSIAQRTNNALNAWAFVAEESPLLRAFGKPEVGLSGGLRATSVQGNNPFYASNDTSYNTGSAGIRWEIEFTLHSGRNTAHNRYRPSHIAYFSVSLMDALDETVGAIECNGELCDTPEAAVRFTLAKMEELQRSFFGILS